MSAVFLKLLNLSITAGWLILAIVLLRPLLKKVPRKISCALWALVALRLVCPFSLESVFSLVPSSETVPQDIAVQTTPAINSGIPAVNQVINPVLFQSFAPNPANSVNPLQILIPAAAAVWLIGMTALLLYAAVSWFRLKQSVGASIPVGEGILACDEVESPFILGILRPVIYVPSTMEGETLAYVIRHETAHIRRHDHWWKPLGGLLLAVYWFHPLCWLAYVLLCRDIELACDEMVIRNMDRNEKALYSQTLLDCSFSRRRIVMCPLAFGEVGVKERVKSVLNYKKPAFWIVVIAVIACAAVAVCFMTNPKNHPPKDFEGVSKWFDCVHGDEMIWDGVRETSLAAFPGVTFRWRAEALEAVTDSEIVPLYTGMPIWSVYFCDLNGDGKPELCSSVSFGSGIVDDRILIYDYANGRDYELSSRERYDYTLNLQEGRLVVEKRFFLQQELQAVGQLSLRDGKCRVEWSSAEPSDSSAQTPNSGSSPVISPDEAALRKKYPKYFDLPTDQGLEVYVWQMASGLYSFAVLPVCDEARGDLDLWNDLEAWDPKGASAEEMKAILATYSIDSERVAVIPYQNPLSSYIGEHWILFEGETPAEFEARWQNYIRSIREMLFDEAGSAQKDRHPPTDSVF